jgi:hypothetical protein
MKLLNKLREESQKKRSETHQKELTKKDEHETMFEHKQYSQELMCPLEPHRTVW